MNGLKVLLVNPVKKNEKMYSFTTIPLGLTSLASIVSSLTNRKTLVYDMQLGKNDEKGLLETVNRYKPDVIGYSMNSHQFSYASSLKKLISEKYSAWHIAGGVHPSAEPGMVLENGFDYAVLGEGELTLTELLDSIENSGDKKSISGIAYLENGKTIITPKRERIKNLDQLNVDFNNIEFDRYSQFATMTSRGCAFGCKFCASETLWEKNVTYRSLDKVIDEISFASQNYKTRGVIVDDNLNLNQSRFRSFCEKIIENKIDFEWSMNSRVDLAKKTNFSLAKKAGCNVVSYGFEAGSQKILEQIDKTIKIEDMAYAVSKPRKYGIRIKTNWIVGLPGGNFDEQLKSIEIMEATKPDVISVHSFTPLPGTPYWNNPEKYGIHFNKKELLEEFNYNTYPLPIKLDYLSLEEEKEIIKRMTDRMLAIGYKLSEDAKPGDKLIHTPLLESPKRGQI
jgi:radical SAM superfamily enzyme YgiQ (UPF0313 family)